MCFSSLRLPPQPGSCSNVIIFRRPFSTLCCYFSREIKKMQINNVFVLVMLLTSASFRFKYKKE